MFFDTHAHLSDAQFDSDRQKLIESFKDYGIEGVITSGYNYPSSLEAVELAKSYEGIYASIGVYPENIEELNENQIKLLEKLAQQKKVVAIGEIGLQYTDNMPSREKQKQGFIMQIEMASRLGLPIVIHCRNAYGDTLAILKENKKLLNNGGTMHCYSGSKEVAKEIIKLGLHLSVGGVSTFKNAENLRSTLKEVPLEKIILETDCPYLTPHPFRGQRNSPCFIPTIAENLAKLKGASVEEVAKITSQNARELFHI